MNVPACTSRQVIDGTERIRIILLGDSGVGKTSLVHFFCHPDQPERFSSTDGCNIDVMLYTGRKSKETYFVEFWEIGGSFGAHPDSRKLFYNPPPDGIIFVHDLTNKKSFGNLTSKWYQEIYRALVDEDGDSLTEGYLPTELRIPAHSDSSSHRHDKRRIVSDRPPIPILVIGTKPDVTQPSSEDGYCNINVSGPNKSRPDIIHSFLERILSNKCSGSRTPLHSSFNNNIFGSPFPSLDRNAEVNLSSNSKKGS